MKRNLKTDSNLRRLRLNQASQENMLKLEKEFRTINPKKSIVSSKILFSDLLHTDDLSMLNFSDLAERYSHQRDDGKYQFI